MNILPYTLSTTQELLTSRAGLVAIAQVMQRLHLTEQINHAFPTPQSNRGFKPSVFINSLVLMLNEGGTHLDDLRHIRNDAAIRKILNLSQIPKSDSVGDWLRRLGQTGVDALVLVNKTVLSAALHQCKNVTLDIDASGIVANKQQAQWTYKKHKGYMPMIGHIAQTGQVASVDFRQGNTSPAYENLEFIKQCEHALPAGVKVNRLRIDAAGYQSRIIEYCDQHHIDYAIRAKMSQSLKQDILDLPEMVWQPLKDKSGKEIPHQQTYRMLHTLTHYEHAFTLVVQRKAIRGQMDIQPDESTEPHLVEEVIHKGYVYRCIATNQETLGDSELIHWYNQRGEDSENRIKELKHDFGADTMPCGDFNANALYFSICGLAYNLFALMRQLLPGQYSHHRVMTIRWRLYALAGKVVQTGRQLYLKLQDDARTLLEEVLLAIDRFKPIPPPPI